MSDESDFYRRIAPLYDPVVGPFLRPVRNEVRRLVRDFGCRRILDIACGTGEQVEMLAADGIMSTGIDLSPAMLSRAAERRNRRVQYFLGDAENLPFSSACFDCAMISLALHEMELESAWRVAEEAIRVLGEDGKLILFDYLSASGFPSGISLLFLHIVERMAGKRHFHNFRRFISHGGLGTFIEKLSLKVVCSRKFLLGAAGLIVLEKS